MAARLWESEVGARRHDLGRLEHRGYLSYEPRLHGRDRIRVRHRPVQYILQQAGLLGSGGPCMMSSPLGFAADAVVNGEEAVGIVKALDAKQARVVGAPEGLLPVLLEIVAFVDVSTGLGCRRA